LSLEVFTALKPAANFVEGFRAAIPLAAKESEDVTSARVSPAVDTDTRERVGRARGQLEHILTGSEITHPLMVPGQRGGDGLRGDAKAPSDVHAREAEAAQSGDVADATGESGEDVIRAGHGAFFAVNQRNFGTHGEINKAIFVPLNFGVYDA
jgi:hypothetical protein